LQLLLGYKIKALKGFNNLLSIYPTLVSIGNQVSTSGMGWMMFFERQVQGKQIAIKPAILLFEKLVKSS